MKGRVVNDQLPLSLPEMGLHGIATIVAVEPCPLIEPDDGTGRPVVTGTMQHLAANLLSVEVEGLPEPLGVTTTHPIWSEDRQDFIPAGLLTVGEQLRNLDGTPARIVRITPHRGPPVPVYNLEVDAQHVYRVGQTGLLVHNTCPTWPSNPKDMDDFLGVPGTPIPDGANNSRARQSRVATQPPN